MQRPAKAKRCGFRPLIEQLEDRRLLAASSLQPVADSYTRPNMNAGAAQVLEVRDFDGGDFMAYLRFDLSALNIDQIESAELTLHKVAGARNDTIVSGRFDVFGLLDLAGNTSQDWSEATLADGGLGSEYTNTAGNGLDPALVANLDQESGADVVETVNNAITAQRLSGADLVSFLNDRVDDDGYATLVARVDASSGLGWGYASREHGDANLKPTLTLQYTEKPPPLRQVERLNRGLVAVRRSASEAYIGWRMFGGDPADVAFNLYRSTAGGDATLLNPAPLTETTDFVDATADLGADNAYFVRPILGGVEQAPSETFTLPADSTVQQRLSVPLQIPPAGADYSYEANDASVGDVDGDGEYEIILKWNPSNAKDNSQTGITGNVYLDAYRMNGQRLWRIDLGRNIRAGAHYTQFMVYDFDGDGKTEVITKTAPGTIDGLGVPVLLGNDQASDDYRNGNGYVLTGSEYLTVFSGLTGAALATVPFEPARGSVSEWGDNYGNRVDRFTAGVAYLDGERPSLVFGRGHYDPQNASGQARNEVVAYDYRDGQLSLRWHFKAGYNINNDVNVDYIGEGAHSLTIGDVDADGRDEIIYGAAAIDDDGTGLYSTTLGHGDALHLSDMDPSRPGLEVFMVHEIPSAHQGVGGEFRDAASGQLLFSIAGTGDIGRGVAADIDPNSPGFEMWATADDRNIYSAAGTALYQAPGNMFYNFVVWWDADLTRELLDGTTISEWNNPGRSNFDLDPGTGGSQIFAPGAAANNGSKSTPALSADILGDWREEVIWRRSDNTALDIYTTIIPAQNRILTLMHDTQYRVAIAWQNGGYNQPPHPSFFLGAGMAAPPSPPIRYAGNSAPAFIQLSDTAVNENVDSSNSDLLFAELSAEDPDPLDAHTFALMPGVGDGDNPRFTISNNQLLLRQGETLDAEHKPAYTIRLRATDPSGAWTEEPFMLNVNDLVELTNQDITIGNGSQRSRFDTLTVTFDSQVTLDSDAFAVTERSQGTAVGVAFTTALDAQSRTVATLSLSGSLVQSGSLMDGNYQLSIDATKVTNASGFGLDSNRDGIVGDDFHFGQSAADAFFRYFADQDGDRDVDVQDLVVFGSAFRASSVDPGFRAEFDFDGDGDVDTSDLIQFGSRFRTALPFH